MKSHQLLYKDDSATTTTINLVASQIDFRNRLSLHSTFTLRKV